MNLQESIKFFCPIFFYHPDESYFPIDPNRYILQAGLKQGKDWLIPQWNSIAQFSEFMNNHDAPSQQQFTLALSISEKDPKLSGSLTAPIYVHILHPPNTRDYYVRYILFFAFNSGVSLFPCCPVTSIGQHQADIEHVTLHFISSENDTEDNVKLSRIYFSSHTGGEWRSIPEGIERDIGGKPIIYVAKGSHAMYAEGKTHIRFCGFGNDYCEKGLQGYHEPVFLPNADDGNLVFRWSFFHGDFGDGHVAGLPQKSWYYSADE